MIKKYWNIVVEATGLKSLAIISLFLIIFSKVNVFVNFCYKMLVKFYTKYPNYEWDGIIFGFSTESISVILFLLLITYKVIIYCSKLKEQLQPQITPAFSLNDNHCLRKFDKEYKTYINVKVSTKSKKTARNCQAFIAEIKKIEANGNSVFPKPFDPIACIWLGTNSNPIDIDYNAPRHFDLFYTCETKQIYDKMYNDSKGKTKLTICGNVPDEIKSFFDEKGIYIFKGYVKSEDIIEKYEIGIKWDGNWDGITEYKPTENQNT